MSSPLSLSALNKLCFEVIIRDYFDLESVYTLYKDIEEESLQNLLSFWVFNKNHKYDHLLDGPVFNGLDICVLDWTAIWDTSNFFENAYVFRERMVQLESYSWTSGSSLNELSFAFLQNLEQLDYDQQLFSFVYDTMHIMYSFHIVKLSDVLLRMCEHCSVNYFPGQIEDEVNRHCIIERPEARHFFQDPTNWCANCVRKPLFLLFDERTCPGNH